MVDTDNYYARHAVVHELLNLTDGEVQTSGTVRMNKVGAASWTALKVALHELEHAQRIYCRLFQDFFAPPKSFIPSRRRCLSSTNM